MRNCLIFFFLFLAGNAQAQGYFYPLQQGKTYVFFKADGLPLPLQFKNAKTHETAMILNEKGLFFDDKEICHWVSDQDPDRYTQEKAFNLTFDKYCPIDSPVIATWGDGGTGAAVVYLRVEKLQGSQLRTSFRNNTLEFDLKTVGAPWETITYDGAAGD